jgi:hypothetical protein
MGVWLIDELMFAKFPCREPGPGIYGYAIESHRTKYRIHSVAMQQMLIDAYATGG